MNFDVELRNLNEYWYLESPHSWWISKFKFIQCTESQFLLSMNILATLPANSYWQSSSLGDTILFCQYSSLKIHWQSDFQNFNWYLHLKWILMLNCEILMNIDIWNLLIVDEFQSLNSSNVQKASAYCQWIYSQLCNPIDISSRQFWKWWFSFLPFIVFKPFFLFAS